MLFRSGKGFIEVRVGLDALVAAAYAAGGVSVSYKYNMQTGEGKMGMGGHLRAVFESNLGVWTQRAQIVYSFGDSDVHM